jgi:protein-tyrosine phosphatase
MLDYSWITDQIVVGGGIWTAENMAEIVRLGFTHVIDMQLEFDDTPLADGHNIAVLWNPTDDDFKLKSPDLFRRGVDFALAALDDPDARIYIHCAAGVHRAPMMALAILRATGWSLIDAADLLVSRRNVVDLADVYVRSVEHFMQSFAPAGSQR